MAGALQFPPYQIIKQGAYDLRLYSSYHVVRVQYEKRDEGYLALGGYFDGQNADYMQFAESQPAVMTYFPDGRKTMQLYIGDTRDGQLRPAVPPLPTDSAVKLEIAGGELVAVLKFDGYVTPQTAEKARARLLDALQQDGLQLAAAEEGGLFRVGQYGALFNFEGSRLNEMMLAVRV